MRYILMLLLLSGCASSQVMQSKYPEVPYDLFPCGTTPDKLGTDHLDLKECSNDLHLRRYGYYWVAFRYNGMYWFVDHEHFDGCNTVEKYKEYVCARMDTNSK